MNAWLYGPDGYYSSFPKVGKEGDFYTSVSTSIFFGGSIGKYIVDLIKEDKFSKNGTVIEIGAHQGYMLADIIQFIYTLWPELIGSLQFVIIEPIASARKAQEEYLKASFKDALDIKFLPSFEGFTCKDAVVVSNELLDAFLCEVVYEDNLLYVKEHQVYFEKIDKELKAKAKNLGVYKGEISLGFEALSDSLAKTCKRCRFISFDYGQEYPRNDFSLRVYKNHQVYPFFSLTSKAGDKEQLSQFFQKSDLTCDVNFAHVKKAFEMGGFETLRIISQMQALVDFGIDYLLAMLQEKVDERTYFNEAQKAKQLILPSFFGERFKMIECLKER